MLKKSLSFPQIIKTFLKYPHIIASHVLTDKANSRLCVNFPSLVQQSEVFYGLPWFLIGKESACRCKRHMFNPWVGKILWRRKWQPTPIFLPGESHGQSSLVGYHKESDVTEHAHIKKNRHLKLMNLALFHIWEDARVWAHQRRKRWHPTPVLLPGKSHGRRRLVGCNPWGR